MDSPLVLVVDDDAECRRVLSAALLARGFRVTCAADGGAGLAQVRREAPRLIVLDTWMPGIDGAGFMRGLPGVLAARPPVILLTAADDEPRLARALGVDVCVQKPVHVARFVRLCEATLRGASASAVTPLPQPERRASPRLRHRRPVRVQLPGGRLAHGTLVDVSVAGLGFEMGGPAPAAGARVQLAVSLADGQQVSVAGRVRHAGGGRLGVSVQGPDATAGNVLDAILAEAGGRRTPGR